MRHNSDGLDILDKGRFESSGVRSDIVDEGKSARGEAARTRGVKGWAPLHHVKNHAEMGKAPKKTGKGRLGKYYKLAKYVESFHLLHNRLSIPRREQRNRARSAFKLIQLNKKYFFLESAQCCIDLCAAHGGWLHVVRKVPVNSLIVGAWSLCITL